MSVSIDEIVATTYERLVAVEVDRGGKASVIRRTPADEVITERVAFEPFLLTDQIELSGLLPGGRQVPLEGSGELTCRIHFSSARECVEAGRELKKETGLSPTSINAPYRTFSDFQQQILTLLPARLFRGMEFSELRRMQIDIETLTSPGFDFPNAEREQDRIILIAMRDSSGWEACLGVEEKDEKRMLERMVELVTERDPDVIEGHNIFGFDLPYIETRSKMRQVKLALGRQGRLLTSRSSRFSAAERTATYRRYTAWGRHIVDTMHLTQLYDVSHRDLESYGLKYVARHFGVAAPDRTYVDGSEIAELYRRDPEQLTAYAMDDVRETDAVSAVLSPSYFYQAQVVPFSYQSCVTRGNAARIDAMLVADYMVHNAALPRPGQARPFTGGLTDSLETGLFNNVWHIDVRSLYPSIIVSQGIGPASDWRHSFRSMLAQLRDFRLSAKAAMQDAKTAKERDHYDALQSSFKVLINSFYGYLGFAYGTFNDFDQAEAVTAEGRRILSSMVDFLDQSGAQVIEIDTDGIYFVPPAGCDDTDEYTRRVQEILPEGIEVELDATYVRMFSYKAKNYALLAEDGTVSVTGAALKSRGLEPFQRDYIRKVLEMLLTGRGRDLQELKEATRRAIAGHQLPLADFAKRETLSTPPAVYKEKLASGNGRRSAAYELVLAADREYKQGDQVAFYVTGTKKNVAVADAACLLADAPDKVRDENVPYYLDKLDKLHRKFEAFVPDSEDPGQLPLFSEFA